MGLAGVEWAPVSVFGSQGRSRSALIPPFALQRRGFHPHCGTGEMKVALQSSILVLTNFSDRQP